MKISLQFFLSLRLHLRKNVLSRTPRSKVIWAEWLCYSYVGLFGFSLYIFDFSICLSSQYFWLNSTFWVFKLSCGPKIKTMLRGIPREVLLLSPSPPPHSYTAPIFISFWFILTVLHFIKTSKYSSSELMYTYCKLSNTPITKFSFECGHGAQNLTCATFSSCSNRQLHIQINSHLNSD